MLPSVTRREWVWAFSVSLIIVALASLPYLVGWLITPAGYRFSGFLINPIDGHSYLAKMGQGAAGSWLFRLPYTAEPHQPVFIFTFHLALGRLAPSGSPVTLIWVYHLARLFFGIGLLVAVYGAAAMLAKSVRQRQLTLLLVGLASGFGWLFGFGPDLTVPEAVTFPSLMVNAHFGLTALLMLMVILGLTIAPSRRLWWVAVAVGSVWLTMIQPYAVLIVGGAAGGWCVINYCQTRRVSWSLHGRLVLFALCSLPLLLYYAWAVRTNPLIGRWMAQNVTPSPPLGEWLVAFGVIWPLAAAGAWVAARRRNPADWLLLAWTAAQVGLMLLPLSLQRRLSTGLHLPLCFLAAMGLLEVVVPRLHQRARRWLVIGLLSVAIPSNLLVMAAGLSAVLNRNPYVVLSEGQWQAMEWLRENVSPDTVVLADYELGTVVPAWGGGVRVVYGHPFETVEAEARRREVEAFYGGRMTPGEESAFLERFAVQVVIVQNGQLPDRPSLSGFRPVWTLDPVTIYRLEDK